MSRPDLSLGLTQLVINACEKQGLLRSEIAYILATGYWESAHTMEPVVEAFWLSEEWRKRNLRYYPWHGRGLVQITWERNYKHAGDRLGVDLTTDPSKVMEPEIAVDILVRGMIEGWFTGRKLSDYITENKADYRGARRIVNGTDQARAIATLAQQYEGVLSELGIGRGAPREIHRRATLHKGMGGSVRQDVINLQKDLAGLGYFSGRTDGRFGRITESAVMEFQRDNGLVVDGVMGSASWSAMDKAKAKPQRKISEDDLRASGSRTIAMADSAEKTTKRVGQAAIGLPSVDVGLKLAEKMRGGQDALAAAQQVVMDNWLILVIAAGGFVVWRYGPMIAQRFRDIRVDDAQSGAHLGR